MGRCEAHKHQVQKEADKARGTAAQRLYGWRWNQYRADYLRRNPLCVDCQQRDVLTPALIVDHEVPHRGDRVLFWDPTNHQSLCKTCHDRKTATEDGGFGNTRRHG